MRTPQEIVIDYKRWLIEQISGYSVDFEARWAKILDGLWKTDYVPCHPMDENRAMDGLYLRKRYDLTFHPRNFSVEEWLEDQECSLLECFVALSVRVFNDYLSSIDIRNASPHTVFMEIMATLGLKPGMSVYKMRVCFAEFCENGVCFRVKNAAEVEIHWQVQRWLNQNWPL